MAPNRIHVYGLVACTSVLPAGARATQTKHRAAYRVIIAASAALLGEVEQLRHKSWFRSVYFERETCRNIKT